MKKDQVKRYKLLPALKGKEVSKPKSKICNMCKTEKPIKDFAKGATYADGHRPTCKKCINEVRKQMEDMNKDLFPF